VATTASLTLEYPRPALLKRLLSILVLLPVFLLIVVKAPGWIFNALVVSASAAALWELTRMLQRAGRPVYARLGVVAGTAVTAAFAVGRTTDPFLLPAFAVVVAVGVILAAPVWQGTASSEATATTLLAVMYIGWLLGYGILLHRSSPRGDDLMLFLVGVTWVGETAAYLVGSTVGHHKLAAVVSPRKTLEGAAAQIVASVLAAMVLRAWLLPSCGPAVAVAAGTLLGITGQVGDLAESAIKRSVGTKESGGLIPGHGGVLDRIDSLLFNLPAFYYVWLAVGCA
jgi:phosphatidate cytidylyltransferase